MKALLKIERDKCERKGIPFDEKKCLEALRNKSKESKRTPFQEIEHGVKTVLTLYTEDRAPGVAKPCLKTVSVYTGNVVKDPSDPKYQSINLANEAF